ncbi:hypothetical protein BV25DRAFT_1915443 [Artomyces pyxidatus]|uniref:Uncharacterized protein n=1 Tax=Artomyces pyxidatus TaxID=48021 RepID=A0ACB8T4R0_9AGAM|nr:hypothetical protein BV25DRAFT_1915443 [Artomyces pyxidatus]
MEGFPQALEHHSPSSVSFRVLSRFSLSLWSIQYPPGQEPSNLDSYRRDVETAPAVLKSLKGLIEADFYAEHLHEAYPSQRTRTRQKKRSKAADVTVDMAPFKTMNVPFPPDRSAADELGRQILVRQRDILICLLTILRRPALSSCFQDLYVLANMSEDKILQPITTMSALEAPVYTEDDSNLVPFSLAVSSLKANCYFVTAKGFGNWRVFLSGSARRSLIRVKQNDAKIFDIYMRKLRELSEGRFSETNQKRLSSTSPVDIFQAHLPGDARIIYQIDCVRECAIKVLKVSSNGE